MIYWGKCNDFAVEVHEGYPYQITVACKQANGETKEFRFPYRGLPDLGHLLAQANFAIERASK